MFIDGRRIKKITGVAILLIEVFKKRLSIQLVLLI